MRRTPRPGRLPTEIGLRFFVDALMQIGDLTESDRKAIEAQVAGRGQAKSVEVGADRGVRACSPGSAAPPAWC